MEKTDSDESNRLSTPSRHEGKMSEVMDSILSCTPVKEHASLQKARVLIAANELYESDESYRKRLNSLPERKSGEIKISTFCKKRSLSTSFEGVDFTQWLSDDSIKDELHSEEKCVGDVTTISEHLWIDEDGTYGLECLFDGKLDLLREDIEVEEIMLERTKNKLFEIFKKMCPSKVGTAKSNVIRRASAGVLVTPGKRKTSSQPGLTNDNPTKTARVHPFTQRPRSETVSNIHTPRNKSLKRSRKKSVTIALERGQMKISNMWREKSAALE